jgi:SseB protein C-terminal domain
MSRAKPSAPNHPQEMQVSEVQFLGEQDGAPERLLKGRLTEFFQRDKSVYRAYLARTSLDRQASVALCVKTKFGADKGLAEKIGAIFGMIFNAHEHLDIIFLSEQQESQLKRVCSTFFDSSDGRNRR